MRDLCFSIFSKLQLYHIMSFYKLNIFYELTLLVADMRDRNNSFFVLRSQS